jgi:hypothetical protein
MKTSKIKLALIVSGGMLASSFFISAHYTSKMLSPALSPGFSEEYSLHEHDYSDLNSALNASGSAVHELHNFRYDGDEAHVRVASSNLEYALISLKDYKQNIQFDKYEQTYSNEKSIDAIIKELSKALDFLNSEDARECIKNREYDTFLKQADEIQNSLSYFKDPMLNEIGIIKDIYYCGKEYDVRMFGYSVLFGTAALGVFMASFNLVSEEEEKRGFRRRRK